MDRGNLHDNLFSRGGLTPPPAQRPLFAPQSSSSSPSHLDSLFQNLSAPSSTHQVNKLEPEDLYSNPAHTVSNMSVNDDAQSTSSAPIMHSPVDRQSALLSLLGSVSSPPASHQGLGGIGAPQLPPQTQTPPGPSQRAGNSPNNDNELQGKYLLEQLMAGNPPRSNFMGSQSLTGSAAPSPPFVQPNRTTPPRAEQYREREGSYASSQDTPRELPQPPAPPAQQQAVQQQQQAPPPQQSPQHHQSPQSQPQQPPQQQQQQVPPSPRKSMFDFVSPFDALASSSSPQSKKKPVPQLPPVEMSGAIGEPWVIAASSAPPPDPKLQSVENLMEQLTRGQGPQQAPPPQHQPMYDPYPSDDFSQNELIQPRGGAPAPPPPPPQQPMRAPSPRASPPKLPVQAQQQQRPQPRAVESPIGQPIQQQAQGPNRREKESSPIPRGNWKSDVKGKGPVAKGKVAAHSQTIIYDVSLPLDEIQASRNDVKSTAIALVRQDSVFLPGTTIGATHWVAYAMTKGRVRVISRSSGDRTLLQLPSIFPPQTSVTDMAVFGNRLAGVTSDGGFIVWELPEVITDDVPGQILLCIAPGNNGDPLHSVKWHPKQAETLAVASDSKIYLMELGVVAHVYRGSPLPQSELPRMAQVFSLPSRLVAFDFDVLHYALATISEDSTLTLWNIPDQSPFWNHKVRGDDVPSSITFVDDGIVIGRRNGTVFQLLSVISKNVLATIKFVNGTQEDPDMFGHVNYDSRVQTLWVANSRRDSLIAFKLGYDTSVGANGEVKGAYFEQVLEFCGPKPTIHFVILSAEADPSGDEAHAACVAAKVPPGELALVAFSVHSTGVDQILIRKEWFESALMSAPAKYPTHQPIQAPPAPAPAPLVEPKRQQPVLMAIPPRIRTPPSEEVEPEINREESRPSDFKGKKPAATPKSKNVGFKDGEENGNGKEKKEKATDASIIADSVLGQALSREIRKSEESLHTRIGRLIGKEMDKQHHRLEDARAHEQAEDFTRQEKILKLISTELTRNTTRVVEMAVKAEVQNSVLPALENITRTEVRAALNENVGNNLGKYVQQTLPIEIEALLVRPDISNHFAGILSNNLNPLIEMFVKESVSKTFIPAYSQQSSAMHQELLHELRNEILSVKKDSIAWQNETVRNQESLIRELEHSVRLLSDQVKYLSMNAATAPAPHHQRQHTANSPGPSVHHQPPQISNQAHLRQQPVGGHGLTSYSPQSQQPYQQLQQQPYQQSPPAQSQWFSSAIAAPQASHPLAPPPPPPPQQRASPVPISEEWDDTYLAVLGTQDPRQLRELLSRSNPEVIMPLNGPGPLSQAVVLTLLHRLAAVVSESPPHDEIFKQSLWWLQRSASALNTNDPLISPYIARVVPNVQQMLNSTKSRCAILPGGPQLVDAVRSISDIQDTLNRKPI